MATKSKLRAQQETGMDRYSVRMPARLARHLRRVGDGNLSDGVRRLGEDHLNGFTERRRGPTDRRKK